MTVVDYTHAYDPDADFDAWYTDVTGAAVGAWLRSGDRVLELGCATGRMTEAIVAAGASVVAVDRSSDYLATARRRGLPGTTWVQADVDAYLVEVAAADARFDTVVAANLLHEVRDPAATLAAAAAVLAPSGRLHVTLQNPQSLHRLVALEMGLLADLCELSDRGRRFGTLRLLTADEIAGIGTAAGLVERHRAGLCLKPLANAQMAALDAAVLDGFARAARYLPGHAAMNHLVFVRG